MTILDEPSQAKNKKPLVKFALLTQTEVVNVLLFPELAGVLDKCVLAIS